MFNKANNPFVSQLKDILNKEPEPVKPEKAKEEDSSKVEQSDSLNEQGNPHGN